MPATSGVRVLLCAAASLLLVVPRTAQAGTDLALWTFEDSRPTTAALFAPELGQGSARGSTHGTFRNDQAVLGNFIGNGSTWSFGSHDWKEGDYFEFQVDTRGFKDIALTWDQTRSQFGPADFALQYSPDGQIFNDFALYSVLWNKDIAGRLYWDSIFERQAVYTFNFDLAGVDAIENAPAALFRLRSSEDGGIPEGSGRVDNFQINATPIPPAAIPLPPALLSGLILLSLVIGIRAGASLWPGVKDMISV